ncbi:MAG TPA: Bax inhibitor-1/YccA family protein [Candidatus Enterocloster faecavium]|uniref:Bax inhibitor-1/YccA family protein n=1 Tax=Candidatus Enterocloster faecavium TaxID=2838560 RepID=A0A9D2L7X1_9FIRM|nr:Bax inhibitor-1/YccA family protein [Candidatus Enterocloster faecavium]
MNEMMNQTYSQASSYGESLGRYTAKTFGWMFAGLLFTFGISVAMVVTGGLFYLFSIPALPYVLLAAELIVVIFLSAHIEKMSVGMARVMFFVYAALNGIVFSAYFLLFDVMVLMGVFLITALFFGIMALIGYFGNINFSSIRPFMMGGLIFLCGFWLLSLFINLSQFETMICTIGIFLFLLFTAYDTKKIQAYYVHYGNMPEMAAKASIFSALQLYLDFINLFLYILRFVGNKRN